MNEWPTSTLDNVTSTTHVADAITDHVYWTGNVSCITTDVIACCWSNQNIVVVSATQCWRRYGHRFCGDYNVAVNAVDYKVWLQPPVIITTQQQQQQSVNLSTTSATQSRAVRPCLHHKGNNSVDAHHSSWESYSRCEVPAQVGKEGHQARTTWQQYSCCTMVLKA